MPRGWAKDALIAAPYLALFALSVANVLRDGPRSAWTIVLVLGVVYGAVSIVMRLRRGRAQRTMRPRAPRLAGPSHLRSAVARTICGMTVNRRQDGIAPLARLTYSFPYRRSP